MPYIIQSARYELGTGYRRPATAGELNYAISMMIKEYVGTFGLSYSTLNEVVGVLECAKLEVYRRMVAPYEDTKIEENGDVYK